MMATRKSLYQALSIGVLLPFFYLTQGWYVLYVVGYVISCLAIWMTIRNVKKTRFLSLSIIFSVFLSVLQAWFVVKFSHLIGVNGSDGPIWWRPTSMNANDVYVMKIQIPALFLVIIISMRTGKFIKG